VTAVAFACGFGNLGHFARDYREVFGERPSMTLARAIDQRALLGQRDRACAISLERARIKP